MGLKSINYTPTYMYRSIFLACICLEGMRYQLSKDRVLRKVHSHIPGVFISRRALLFEICVCHVSTCMRIFRGAQSRKVYSAEGSLR